MKEVENNILENQSVIKIPERDDELDEIVSNLSKAVKEGKNPFTGLKYRENDWQEEEEEVSIYELNVNNVRYEEYLFPGSVFEDIYSTSGVSDYWSHVMKAGGYYVDSRELAERFYAEVDGKKFNIYEKIKSETNNSNVVNYTKAYILHALTQKNVKISVVNSDGTETFFDRVPMSENDIWRFNNDLGSYRSNFEKLLRKYSNYKISSNRKLFSDPDALTDVKKFSDNNTLKKAREIVDKEFEDLFDIAKRHSPNPFAEMIIRGIPGYENGISVADYGKIMFDQIDAEKSAYSGVNLENLNKYIFLHVSTNPNLEITYTPRLYEYDKDGAKLTNTTFYTFYINGKKGIETYSERDRQRRIEESRLANANMDNAINAINSMDISSIHDIEINKLESKESNFYIGGYFPMFKGKFATKENLSAAASRFDEIFKDVLTADKDFFDKIKITTVDKEISLSNFYKKIIESKKYEPAIDIKENEVLFKKAMVISLLCTNCQLEYKNGIYTKGINKVKQSPLKRAIKNQRELAESFRAQFYVKDVFKPSINSKDRYNKRIVGETLTEEELAEAEKAFDKTFKKFKLKNNHDDYKLLENLEFKADEDLDFENVLSYVDDVYYGEDFSKEQRILYAKAFIMHALADPREKIRYRNELINPDTGEVIKDAPEEEKYLYERFTSVPKEYKPEVKKLGQFKPKKIDNEKLFAEAEEKNAAAREEINIIEGRRLSFNDMKEALDLISSINDTEATKLSINQGEKAGKHMEIDELLGLSEAELDAAEKAFDETFKDLIAYDAKVKSFRYSNPTTDYTNERDLFTYGFEIGDYAYFNKVSSAIYLDLGNKNHYEIGQKDIRNKAYERYMKAFLMRALTVKDDNLIFNPLVRESIGTREISRYDWHNFDYMAKFMDINHPVKANLEDIDLPEVEKNGRSGVEIWADDKEANELKEARENTKLFGVDAANKRPFEGYGEVDNEDVIKEEPEDATGDSEELRKQAAKAAMEFANAVKENEEREYNFSHDLFGHELSPEEAQFNRREYELNHANMEYDEYEKALEQLEKDREAYKKSKKEEADRLLQEKQNREKAEEERKWNDPEELNKMKVEAEANLKKATNNLNNFEDRAADLNNPAVKPIYMELKSRRDKYINEIKKIDDKLKELLPEEPEVDEEIKQGNDQDIKVVKNKKKPSKKVFGQEEANEEVEAPANEQIIPPVNNQENLQENIQENAPLQNNNEEQVDEEENDELNEENRIDLDISINNGNENNNEINNVPVEAPVRAKSIFLDMKSSEPQIILSYADVNNHIDRRQRAILYGMSVISLFNDLSADLNKTLNSLRNTQDNRNANFIQGVRAEGPDEYINVINSLREVISIITNNEDHTRLGEMKNKLNTLFANLETYEKKHRPRFRGHRSEATAKRYELIKGLCNNRNLIARTMNSLFAETGNVIRDAEQLLTENDNNINNINENAINLANVELHSIKSVLIDRFNTYVEDGEVKNYDDKINDLEKDVDYINDKYKFDTQKQIYVDKVIRYFEEHTDFRDARGYYNQLENNDDPQYKTGLTASVYEYVETALVKRTLKKLYDRNSTLEDIKALTERTIKGDFKKEVSSIADSNAAVLDAQLSVVLGDKKSEAYEKVVNATEKSFIKLSKAYKEISGYKAGDDKNSISYLRGFDAPNNDLVYNIAMCSVFSKPKNKGLIVLQNLLNNSLMDLDGSDRNKTAAKNAVKGKLIEYIRKTGITRGINTFNNLPELINRIENPAFQKGFEKVAKNVLTDQKEKYQRMLSNNAKEEALLAKGDEAGRRMRARRIENSRKAKDNNPRKI